jgi:hypothetical protein
VKKRPCRICRKWFRPDRRVGSRQRACGKPECQRKWRAKSQAAWRSRQPDYFIERRLRQRSIAAREAAEAAEKRKKIVQEGKVPEVAKAEVRRPPPLRLPGFLGRLPWDLAQDEIGVQTTDWIGLAAKVVRAMVKDEIRQKAL